MGCTGSWRRPHLIQAQPTSYELGQVRRHYFTLCLIALDSPCHSRSLLCLWSWCPLRCLGRLWLSSSCCHLARLCIGGDAGGVVSSYNLSQLLLLSKGSLLRL